jgi:hypothetical protein
MKVLLLDRKNAFLAVLRACAQPGRSIKDAKTGDGRTEFAYLSRSATREAAAATATRTARLPGNVCPAPDGDGVSFVGDAGEGSGASGAAGDDGDTGLDSRARFIAAMVANAVTTVASRTAGVVTGPRAADGDTEWDAERIVGAGRVLGEADAGAAGTGADAGAREGRAGFDTERVAGATVGCAEVGAAPRTRGEIGVVGATASTTVRAAGTTGPRTRVTARTTGLATRPTNPTVGAIARTIGVALCTTGRTTGVTARTTGVVVCTTGVVVCTTGVVAARTAGPTVPVTGATSGRAGADTLGTGASRCDTVVGLGAAIVGASSTTGGVTGCVTVFTGADGERSRAPARCAC